MQRRALPLRAKVLMSQNRIREWYQHFNGDVYVSFSGGKDSTVLAHLVHDLYPDVPLVFSNTGLEYPEIQSFARKMGAEFIRPKMQFSEVISKYGYPIISKEVSEAIYYARRIRNGGGYGTTKKYRDDFHGLRVYGQQTPERLDGWQRQNIHGGGTTERTICTDNIRRNLLTGGNGRIARYTARTGEEYSLQGNTDGSGYRRKRRRGSWRKVHFQQRKMASPVQ